MAATKKNAISTTLGASKAFAAASRKIAPTRPLPPAEQLHFDSIIASRETASWARHDISLATQLAAIMTRLDEVTAALTFDTLTQINDKGTRVANPLLSAMMQMSSSVQAMSRSLGLSASQRALSGGHQAKRNDADAKAREVIERAQSTDLV